MAKDVNDNVTISPEITNFSQSGLKQINAIHEYDNKLYLATSFAIVVYDIENLEFGDTYFIGFGSTNINVTDITVFNNEIFAATDDGIYVADVTNPNLIDANNWTLRFAGTYEDIAMFGGDLYATSNSDLVRLDGTITTNVLTFSETISSVKVFANSLSVSLSNDCLLYTSPSPRDA